MKQIALYFFTIIVIVLLLPSLLVQFGRKHESVIIRPIDDSQVVKVFITKEDKVVDMGFETYLKGVLAAEMPATFEVEALKAQAIAARSYAVYHMQNRNEDRVKAHKGGDVCTDYHHCNAWVSDEEMKKNWGKAYEEKFNKIASAVDDTRDLVAMYQGKPINAVFHAMSSGKTERAADVWHSDIPYLQSVESKGEDSCPNFQTTVTVTMDEFWSKLKQAVVALDVPKGKAVPAFLNNQPNITHTVGGGVAKIDIANQSLEGKNIRQIFGLRSANFTLEQQADKMIFHVTGFGHGVGLSQNGANSYAKEGKSATEILKHYYKDVDVKKQ